MRWPRPVHLALAAVGLCFGLSAAVGTDAGSTNAVGRPPHFCPRGDPEGFNGNRLIGKRLPGARTLANHHGCSVRVVKRDGEYLPVTEDFSPTRINVAVWDRRVTGIDGVG